MTLDRVEYFCACGLRGLIGSVALNREYAVLTGSCTICPRTASVRYSLAQVQAYINGRAGIPCGETIAPHRVRLLD